jgi:hypothetical protein
MARVDLPRPELVVDGLEDRLHGADALDVITDHPVEGEYPHPVGIELGLFGVDLVDDARDVTGLVLLDLDVARVADLQKVLAGLADVARRRAR